MAIATEQSAEGGEWDRAAALELLRHLMGSVALGPYDKPLPSGIPDEVHNYLTMRLGDMSQTSLIDFPFPPNS